MNRESVYDAFIRQTGIDPASYTQTEEYEKELQRRETEADMVVNSQIINHILQPKIITHHIDILRTVNDGDLDQVTESHPNLANYDHSLEMDRWRMIGGLNATDGIEMG